MAAALEISVNAAVAAVSSQLDATFIFTEDNKMVLGGVYVLVQPGFGRSSVKCQGARRLASR